MTLTYESRAANEAKFFETIASFSELPPMIGWWSIRHLRPRITSVFATNGPIEFYLRPIRERASEQQRVKVLSLGSGDGELEVSLSVALSRAGVENVNIVGIELSRELVARSVKRASAAEVAKCVTFEPIDFNSGWGDERWDLVIANQVLHHIVNLEFVLDEAHRTLCEDGALLTRDMIGRNGHQAWPEAKAIVDKIWGVMPKRYRYHRLYKRNFPEFPDFDFSTAGFEGVRAQDILQLCVQRFGFSRFYAFGGIVERFVNRGFGGNYQITSEDDCAFVDNLQLINDLAIDSGLIKPTQMAAYLHKGKRDCKFYSVRSPAFCVRVV
jgi:SAM-dependent methyltransferase